MKGISSLSRGSASLRSLHAMHSPRPCFVPTGGTKPQCIPVSPLKWLLHEAQASGLYYLKPCFLPVTPRLGEDS